MYKRKGCELWTIEEKDFKTINRVLELNLEDIKERNYNPNKMYFLIKDLWVYKDIDLLKQIDVILEIYGIRYLGYLEVNGVINNAVSKDFYEITECKFIICQENYLKDVEIIKEIEYSVE